MLNTYKMCIVYASLIFDVKRLFGIVNATQHSTALHSQKTKFMSGSDLRKAASDGNAVVLRDFIEQRCNPCSVDEYGLSPLHYAVWNGHVECVKLLICNTLGVNAKGVRDRSTELVSCMGYTGERLTKTIIALDVLDFVICFLNIIRFC